MRKHSLGLAIAGILAPSLSFALGLGEISTNSALNQPLDAEIELVSTTPGEVENVTVNLAPNAVFDQVGIERTAILEQLTFSPTVINGVPVIKVTSPGSIQEPFVNFVIEVNWPKGKLLREYTVLLDPPVLSDNAGVPPIAAQPIFTGVDSQVVEAQTYPVEEALPVEMVEPIVQSVEEPPVVAETYPVEDASVMPVEVDEGLETFSVADADAGEGLPPFIDTTEQVYQEEITEAVDFEPATDATETYASLDAAPGTTEIFVSGAGDSTVATTDLFADSVAYEESIEPVSGGYAGGGEYTVNPGDTLSGIASETRGGGVSLSRMMATLFSSNKSAFQNSSVHELKAGYVLRVPDDSIVADMSEANAKAIIAANGGAWEQYRQKLAKTATPQGALDAAKSADGKKSLPGIDDLADGKKTSAVDVTGEIVGATKPKSGLEILAPEKGQSATGSAAGDASGGDAVKEQLASKAQESSELRSRIEELEGLLTAKERLITLKDEQLADMQQSLGTTEMDVKKAEEGGESAPSGKGLLPSGEAESTEKVADKVAEEIKTEDPVETIAAADPAQNEVAAAPDTSVEESKPAGLLDDLKKNPRKLLLGGGAGLLILALFAWLASRKKGRNDETIIEASAATESDDLSTVVTDEAESESEELPEHDVVDVATEYDNELATGQFDSIDLEQEFEETSHSIQLSADELNIQPEDIRADLSSVDAGSAEDEMLSEANVYLAYGLHDQAIDLLKPAVEANPGRNDYQAKLLEAYHATNNRDAFTDSAERLHASLGNNDSSLWQRVIVMGKDLIPDHELFKNADPGDLTLGGISKDRPDLASVDLDDMPELEDGQETVSISGSDIQEVLDEPSGSQDFRLPELDELNQSVETGAEDAISLAEADKSQEISLDDLGDLESDLSPSSSSMLSGIKGAGAAAAGTSGNDEENFTLADMESEFTDMSTGADHIGTKLDLAKAYMDMGDEEGAKEALDEVVAQGNDEQKTEAKKLLEQIA